MDQAVLIGSVIWLAVLSPGADFAMVSRNSCLYGPGAGFAVSAGIAIACWFHIAYAIFGIAIVERTAPDALSLVRILGAAYLIAMGVSTALRQPAPAEDFDRPAPRRGRGVLTGILTNGLNPKTSVFVVSLYSQALGQEASLARQLAWGGFISLSHLGWFCLVSACLSKPDIRAFVLRRQRAFNFAIGVVLTLFGVMLLSLDRTG